MITGQLKSRVNTLWDAFWTGGISNPLTVIEQITFLLFLRLLDVRETTAERQWNRKSPGKPFPGLSFKPDPDPERDQVRLRWSRFRNLGGDEMLRVVRDEVFPHLRTIGGEYLKDAQCLIPKGSLLASSVELIEQLPLTGGDTKGDLYEYLLSKLTTAGINGQFRTPRHIIAMMVKLAYSGAKDREELTWTVADPACGTAGFLVGAMQYLTEKYTSDAGKIEDPASNGDKTFTYTGDDLKPEERQHLRNGMFFGFDFDATMLRIAAMNLMLHNADRPNIHYQDALSNSFPDRFPKQSTEAFDLVLANPPFKGSLDDKDVHPSLTGKVKTRKTELLFVVLLLRMLKLGGRCAMIVPDGVLFGSSKAHIGLRKMLVEEHQLEAVVKLPAGVFKPYAGVSTAVLLFTKGGRTGHVWFYDVQADGFTLDDKRTKIGPEDDFQDISDVPVNWAERNPKTDMDRTAKAFFVPKADIVGQDYDLSLGRYKDVVHEEVKYDPPKVILGRLRKLEQDIAADLGELERMLL
jgi:type I restriction enzyme M protein